MINLIFCILYLTLVTQIHSISKHPILLVISFDAFRYDYLNQTNTPYLFKLLQHSTSTHHMVSVFPTKTFPNHFSIATGLYSEVHGVTGNSIYCPKAKKIIEASYELFHFNEHIEPLWTHNEILGDDRHSGVMMWAGGRYEYHNVKPTFSVEFTRELSLKKRIDIVISWITHPDTPANLIFAYLDEPDYDGHIHGVESPEFFNELKKLDDAVKYLDDELKKINLLNKVNIVQVSDHGMKNVQYPSIINISAVVDPYVYYDIAERSPFLHILPKRDKFPIVYKSLKQFSLENGHFRVFKRDDLFERWHIKNTDRCPPIILLADPGYVFDDFWKTIKLYEQRDHKEVKYTNSYGVHGYDNTELEMAGYFLARGPAIKQNFVIPPFNNVDLYSLFCAILRIPPAPNNGTFEHVRHVLRLPEEDDSFFNNYLLQFFTLFVGGAVATILCLTCVGFTVLCLVNNRRQNEGMTVSKKHYVNDIDLSAFNKSAKYCEAQMLLSTGSDDNEDS